MADMDEDDCRYRVLYEAGNNEFCHCHRRTWDEFEEQYSLDDAVQFAVSLIVNRKVHHKDVDFKEIIRYEVCEGPTTEQIDTLVDAALREKQAQEDAEKAAKDIVRARARRETYEELKKEYDPKDEQMAGLGNDKEV